MDFIIAAILGIVEGVTEFLPISSTGHLILVEDFLHLGSNEAFKNAFTVIIQLPAILAVVVYFWKEMWPFQGARTLGIFRLWVLTAVAFIPSAVLGLAFDDLIDAHLLKPFPVAMALLVGGVALIVLERRKTEPRITDLQHIAAPLAFAVGCFQCLALFPGTSRSAATIIGAMLLGLSRSAAAEFSFFLAVPTMLGATTLKVLKNGLAFTPHEWLLLGVGSVVSFVTAYFVVAFLMAYIRRHTFVAFGVYRIVLAVIVLAVLFLRG